MWRGSRSADWASRSPCRHCCSLPAPARSAVSLNVSVTYVALRGGSGALSAATFAVLARAYGPAGYAEVALAVAAALLVASVAFGPLRAALARFSSSTSDPPVLVNLFHRIAIAIALVGLASAVVSRNH